MLLLTVPALSLLVGCAGSGSDKAGGKRAGKPLVLTLASFLGNSEEVDGFAGEVQRLSAGTMRIEVRSRWRLGQIKYENALISDVRAGKADLGVVGSRAWDSVGATSLRALVAPLLIDSYALQDRVVRSPIVGEMLQRLAPLDLVGLGLLPGPLRKPLGIAHPLLKPSDYAQLRIGVQQSRVADATMRALGAKPVWFPAEGSITRFGGIEQQISAIQGDHYYKVGKYLTANVNLWPRPLVLFANRKTFAELTPDQRRILRRAVADDLTAETKYVRDGERTDTSSLCRGRQLRFLTASSAEIAELRRAVQPVYDQIERDPQTLRYIRQIEVMRKGIPSEPAPSCARSVQPAAKAGPLDGVYRYTVTLADMRAAGADQSELVPENFGTTTIVIDRGRFAFTLENDAAHGCTWGYGTFTVKEHQFEQLFKAGGGIAPTNAVNKPGELFTFGWSLYRDTVRVRPVKSAVSPTGVFAEPWHRISTTPSPRFLSSRCPPPAQSPPR